MAANCEQNSQKWLASRKRNSARDHKRGAPPKLAKEDSVEDTGIAQEMLECPVCLEYPRTRPIYTCDNGHVVCSTCKEASSTAQPCRECRDSYGKECLGVCPTCREHGLKPDKFVGRLADKLLERIMIRCKFTTHGCEERQELSVLAKHEEECPYREVDCPAIQFCQWTGSLITLMAHIRNNGCVKILRKSNINKPFRSIIPRSKQATNGTILSSNVEINHYKPVLLIDRFSVKYSIFLAFQRTEDGWWFIQVQSLCPQPQLHKIKVRLEILRTDTDEPHQKFIYEGGVTSNKWTHYEAVKTGRFILLQDAHMNLGTNASLTFCEYTVSISINNSEETSVETRTRTSNHWLENLSHLTPTTPTTPQTPIA